MDYSDKYLKYKNKYLELKNSIQNGGDSETIKDWINKPMYYKRTSLDMSIQPVGSDKLIDDGSHLVFTGDLFSDEEMTNKIGNAHITYTFVTLYDISVDKHVIHIVVKLMRDNASYCEVKFHGKVDVPPEFSLDKDGKLAPYVLNTILLKVKTGVDTFNDVNNLEYDINNGKGVLKMTN
jgi:hypothetical protein